MTAPVLPGAVPSGAVAGVGDPQLTAEAARAAERVLGTLFVPLAAGLAGRLVLRAPRLVRRGHPRTWAAAIAFLLAEEAQLFAYDPRVTPASLARELGARPRPLRHRAARIRAHLVPLGVQIPPVAWSGVP